MFLSREWTMCENESLQDYSEISNFHNSSFHSAQIGNSMFTVVSNRVWPPRLLMQAAR